MKRFFEDMKAGNDPKKAIIFYRTEIKMIETYEASHVHRQ